MAKQSSAQTDADESGGEQARRLALRKQCGTSVLLTARLFLFCCNDGERAVICKYDLVVYYVECFLGVVCLSLLNLRFLSFLLKAAG